MLNFPEVNFGFVRLDKLLSRFHSFPLIFLIRNKAGIEGVGTRGLVFESYLQSKKKSKYLRVCSPDTDASLRGFIQVLIPGGSCAKDGYKMDVVRPQTSRSVGETLGNFQIKNKFKACAQSCEGENS